MVLRLSEIMGNDLARKISPKALERRKEIERQRDDGTDYWYSRYSANDQFYAVSVTIAPPKDSEYVVELERYGLSQRSMNRCDEHGVQTIAEFRVAVQRQRMLEWSQGSDSMLRECQRVLGRLDDAILACQRSTKRDNVQPHKPEVLRRHKT